MASVHTRQNSAARTCFLLRIIYYTVEKVLESSSISELPSLALILSEVDNISSDDHIEDQNPTNGFEYTGQAWQVRTIPLSSQVQ